MKGKRGRILWIDSAISELKPYVRFLEYQGYDVSLTDSGTEGLTLLKGWTYHAVLVNHEIPMRNGALLSHIRKEDAHIPIVLLTSREEQEAMQQASFYEVGTLKNACKS